MVRFCDKEAVACTMQEIEKMSRNELLSFFWKNGTLLILLVFEDDGSFAGCITYDNVLKNASINNYLIKTRFQISDSFWQEAKMYFEFNPEEIVPVCNAEGKILGLCYSDRSTKEYIGLEHFLDYLEINLEQSLFIQEIWPSVQQVCITDCNELAYRIYEVCLKKGIPVCLTGEKWEWFGCDTSVGICDYPEFAKFYIYAEGNRIIRKEDEFKKSCRYGSVMESFYFLMHMKEQNIANIRYRKEKDWKNKGIKVCNIIVPRTVEIKNQTRTELEIKNMNVSLEKYVDNYEWISDYQRGLIEKTFGKRICEYCREKGSTVYREERKYLQGDALYYVSNELYYKRIYVIGPCITAQRGVRTKENLISRIQDLVEDYKYTVVGCTIANDMFDWDSILDKLPIRNSDIIIFIHESVCYNEETKKEFLCLNTAELYEQKNREDWYDNGPIHMNAASTKALADYIYSKYLKEELDNKVKLDEKEAFRYLQRGKGVIDNELDMLDKYINDIADKENAKGGAIGSIVMNCNPFTLGHLYLIEKAAKAVEFLYIFVVQENKSYFKFEERFEMVRKGTAHLPNVKVVPSGEMILSYSTLPVYFEKQERQEAIIDASKDLEIFGEYIAPSLNITYRFIGEEPYDKVTRQYNEQMKEILSLYGICVIEIPRKEIGGEAISASRVRKLFEKKEYVECKKLVPETTWEIVHGKQM